MSMDTIGEAAQTYRYNNRNKLKMMPIQTSPVVLKVVTVTRAVILQVTMDQLMCASLFPHPLLVWSGHVDG